MLPGASTSAADEAFQDFAISRLITEEAVRHFHARMHQIDDMDQICE